MKFTFITVSAPALKSLMKAAKEIMSLEEGLLELRLYYAVTEYGKEKTDRLISDIKTSDMVFVDLMGSPVETVKAVYEGLRECNGNVIPYGNSAREYLKLGSFSAAGMMSGGGKKPDMAAMKKMQSMAEAMGKIMPGKMRDMRNYSLICKYFYVADYNNILNMLYLILREYGGGKKLPKPAEPREVPAAVVCRPKDMKCYGSFKEFSTDFPFVEEKPVIAFLYYGHIYPMDYSGAVAEICERLQKSANVLPVAVSGMDGINDGTLKKLLTEFMPAKTELIMNCMSFRLSAGPMGGNISAGTDMLKELNVPYLHPLFMSRRTEKDWKDSVQGCTASEVLISVMLPEQDGAMLTLPVGAKTEPEYDEEFDVTSDEIKIIEERLEALADRAEKFIELRKKARSAKKIAIICYNYPPGESNVFGGAFLDTFESVSAILSLLKNNGYTAEEADAQKLMSDFINGGLVNTGKYSDDDKMLRYSLADYKKFLNGFADRDSVVNAWGEPGGDIMTDDNGDFLIPAAVYGNVLVGIQPSRGLHEDNDKLYHDKSLPPHHQYIAFYRYLHDKFGADAVIHVGTHGTLEFLKGKECGMSGTCYPDMLLYDTPHFYLYYCGNPAEATIAKRRSHAALVGYQPPVFIQSGLYGEYAELAKMLDDYHHQLAFSKSAADEVKQNIAALAEKLSLPTDMEELESELYRLNSSLIPKGLHIFGQAYSDEEAQCYVRELLKKPHDDTPSLCDIAAEELGIDLVGAEEKGGEPLRKINALAEEYLDKYFAGESVPEKLSRTIEYGRKKYAEVKQNAENEQLLNALSGGYIPAKAAGDIYRSPEVLPSGYNLYQFDQRFVPTLTAYQRGARAAENTIKTYFDKYGHYPNSTAVILWGLETSRTQGETIGQIMAYLGARLAKGNSAWNPKYELIPIEELGRPRIDVTINICGFFRDLFPNIIDNLDDLLHLVNEADETDGQNYMKANSKKLYAYLTDRGYDHDEAERLSVTRLFGPREGEYGTGITSIIETKAWEKEEQIGSRFLTSLHYAYNRKERGGDMGDLYEQNLKSVEIVSQVRDNNEYEITDLDHYYEFFGGLAKSVEMVRGQKAVMLITDTTGAVPVTETAEKAVAKGIRTRVLNPKWIDGMLAHKYHGAQKIADRFENVMGLAATTGAVEQWIYNDLCAKYAQDKEMRRRMAENNPYAYMDILEQMEEYSRRGYWNADKERLEAIRQAYLETENRIEGEDQ